MKLDKFFNPKTIAVIGASDRKGSVGYALMDNLINSEYEGIVYPINNKRESIHAIKAYNSVKEIDDEIDLAIIAVPAQFVPQVIKDCGEAGVGGAIIVSAGFQEIGREGEKLQKTILEYAKSYDMRILGPNCLGFIHPKIKLNASFSSQMALPGKIAFISQSGALCTAILDWSLKNNVGFSHFVSIGSMVDLSFHDLIDYFGTDPDTNSILIYMESITDARKFLSAARAFSRQKPIIVLKVGRSEAGAKAAKSHTGSLSGNDEVFDAAFRRAGIVRVNTTVGLFHTAKALAMQEHPQGKKMCVITNAGGPGVIATDRLSLLGGEVANLEKTTIEKLNKFLPASWSKGNPVDILGDADPERYAKTLEVCLNDKNADSILIILTPQAMTEPTEVAKRLVKIENNNKKTILASWMGGHNVLEGRQILEKGNIPIYRQPEDAIQSFMNIYRYSENLKNLYETPATTPHAFIPKTDANKIIIKNAFKEKRGALTEYEAKKLLDNYDIPTVNSAIAQSANQASELAAEIGFPVAMKILSPDILHKTEIGGVKLNINSHEEAQKAYNDIIKSIRQHEPSANINGILIEAMLHKKYELLIGSRKDPLFGPVIVFGMGGVAVEVFKDTTIGLPPLNMSLSLQMISRTKIYNLLKGYRNMPGVDIQAIQFLLYKFAYLVSDFPEIKEIDINPFAVDENGGIVLDAKVVLDETFSDIESKPYSHLVISPYPKQYTSEFKLKNNKKALLRPIKPEDEPLEAEMFTNFSKETERHRFFKQIGEISHEMLIRYTQIDYDREIAIVALLEEKGKRKMIGVVRLIANPASGDAEFALVVADPWQNQGLGGKFLDLITKIARDRDMKMIYGKFLKDNSVMEKMFKDRNFEIRYHRNKGLAELKLDKE